MYTTRSVTRKKSPNVYLSCSNIISLEKLKILKPSQRLLEIDLGKLLVAKALKSCPKSNKLSNLVTLTTRPVCSVHRHLLDVYGSVNLTLKNWTNVEIYEKHFLYFPCSRRWAKWILLFLVHKVIIIIYVAALSLEDLSIFNQWIIKSNSHYIYTWVFACHWQLAKFAKILCHLLKMT